MTRRTKSMLFLTGIMLAAGIGSADWYLWRLVSAATGVEAKLLCSGVFVSDRAPNAVISEDLQHEVNFIRLNVDAAGNTVTATAFGLIKREAVYREGLGATLVTDSTATDIMAQLRGDLRPQPRFARTDLWPRGNTLPDTIPDTGIDRTRLERAIDTAFAEPDPALPKATRAIVVVHHGQLAAERYAPGFTRDTALPGFGLTMTVMNALAGMLEGDSRLSVDDPVAFPAWSSDDPRQDITIGHLMRMTSGLEFDDDKEPLSDSVLMYGSADMAAFAAKKPLLSTPGEVWAVSNGSAVLTAWAIRKAIGGTTADYWAYPHRRLFDRCCMTTAVIEPDAAGTFVGSSGMYASARDWARLGMLFLNDGVWENERILPEGWMTWSLTPTPADQSRTWGAMFELNPDGEWWPGLPADMFVSRGHNGQSLTVIPSLGLVVVRLGFTPAGAEWNLLDFLQKVVATVG